MPDVLPPSVAPAAASMAPDPGTDGLADGRALRKKRDKLRSAWISFVSRILAQLIGAVSTVLLGLYVVSTYQQGVRPAVVTAASSSEATPVRTPRPGGQSLAVLPFQDFSPGTPAGYLADGLTEALIARLAQSRQVHVISRTSSMHFKASRDPLPVIARALQVDYIVEGSVVRHRNRVRVTVQLIDARTDDHVWAETFDRQNRDLLGLQAEVSQAIAGRLHAALPAAGEAARP